MQQEELLGSLHSQLPTADGLEQRLASAEGQRKLDADQLNALSQRLEEVTHVLKDLTDSQGALQQAVQSCQKQTGDNSIKIDLSTTRIDRTENELTKQAADLAMKADKGQIISSLEHLLDAKLNDVEQRLGEQTNASMELRSVVAETHRLLEHLLSSMAAGARPIPSSAVAASVAYRH